MNDAPKSFDSSFKDFLAYVTEVLSAPCGSDPKLDVQAGNKYIRVVRNDIGRSVYCFVDATTGDILKPASWKAPAKHARGNIYNPMTWTCVGPYGIAYLNQPNAGGAHVNPVAMANTEKKAAPIPVELPKRRDPKPVFTPHVCRSQPCEHCMST